jgi:hypothetical protein
VKRAAITSARQKCTACKQGVNLKCPEQDLI